jgi:membrane-bound lytic murein transglycosylase D
MDLLKKVPQTAASAVAVVGDAEAELTKPGKAMAGQRWTFRLTQPTRIDGMDFQPGDQLYALVDDVDAQGRVFLRATKLQSATDGNFLAVSLIALNPVSGLAGLPLPKSLRVGWRVQWQINQ